MAPRALRCLHGYSPGDTYLKPTQMLRHVAVLKMNPLFATLRAPPSCRKQQLDAPHPLSTLSCRGNPPDTNLALFDRAHSFSRFASRLHLIYVEGAQPPLQEPNIDICHHTTLPALAASSEPPSSLSPTRNSSLWFNTTWRRKSISGRAILTSPGPQHHRPSDQQARAPGKIGPISSISSPAPPSPMPKLATAAVRPSGTRVRLQGLGSLLEVKPPISKGSGFMLLAYPARLGRQFGRHAGCFLLGRPTSQSSRSPPTAALRVFSLAVSEPATRESLPCLQEGTSTLRIQTSQTATGRVAIQSTTPSATLPNRKGTACWNGSILTSCCRIT